MQQCQLVEEEESRERQTRSEGLRAGREGEAALSIARNKEDIDALATANIDADTATATAVTIISSAESPALSTGSFRPASIAGSLQFWPTTPSVGGEAQVGAIQDQQLPLPATYSARRRQTSIRGWLQGSYATSPTLLQQPAIVASTPRSSLPPRTPSIIAPRTPATMLPRSSSSSVRFQYGPASLSSRGSGSGGRRAGAPPLVPTPLLTQSRWRSAPEAGEAPPPLAVRLARQLWGFQGCAEHAEQRREHAERHCQPEMCHSLGQITTLLQGTHLEDQPQLHMPDILSQSEKMMARGDKQLEQLDWKAAFEGLPSKGQDVQQVLAGRSPAPAYSSHRVSSSSSSSLDLPD